MSIVFEPHVLELLSSRICHDLVSPVGAVSNGIELMEELGDSVNDEAISLISSSAEQASVRLKCFRLAYGVAGSQESAGFLVIYEAFSSWIQSGRLSLEWDVMSCVHIEPPKGFMKTLLQILMVAEECNPVDGVVSVTALENGQGVLIAVVGKPSFRDGMEKSLIGDVSMDDLTPRLVHSYITGKTAEFFNFNLSHKQVSEQELHFEITF